MIAHDTLTRRIRDRLAADGAAHVDRIEAAEPTAPPLGYERIAGLRLPGQMPDGTFSGLHNSCNSRRRMRRVPCFRGLPPVWKKIAGVMHKTGADGTPDDQDTSRARVATAGSNSSGRARE
jgi:hypothetical protein